ncbi:hypothetical protein V8C40DRAFT_260204 [Trichoderma camerunense]
MAELVKHMEESNALTVKRINVLESSRERLSYTPAQNRGTAPAREFGNSGAPGDNDKQRNPDFWWCFKCGQWGHMGWSCPLGENFNKEAFAARRREWETNGMELRRERASRLRQGTNSGGATQSVKAATWLDGGASSRPPAGYRPVENKYIPRAGRQATPMAGAANYTTEARRDCKGWEDEKLVIGESYAATRRQPKQVRFDPLANPRSSPHPKLPRAGSIPPDDNESHDRPGLVTLGSKRGGNSTDTEGRRGTDSETPEFREELMTSVEDPITTISAEQFEK